MNITLKIFDHLFKLDCDPAQESHLRRAAAKLDQKLLDAKAITPRLDNERLAILVALELCQQQLAQAALLQDHALCEQLVQQLTTDAESLLTKV